MIKTKPGGPNRRGEEVDTARGQGKTHGACRDQKDARLAKAGVRKGILGYRRGLHKTHFLRVTA